MRFLFSSILCTLLASCSTHLSSGVHSRAKYTPDQLTIPANEHSIRSLDALTRAAKEDPKAAWTRIAYLLALFDDARYRNADDSLAVLVRFLQLNSKAARLPRGPKLTDAIIKQLILSVDKILTRNRLHANAQSARTLLEFDQSMPTHRNQVAQRMVELKAIANTSPNLVDNAEMRLASYCTQALHDTVRARWADRTQILSHCLYPLYDANPAPYFARDPNNRPPPPAWEHLTKRLGTLLGRIANRKSQLHLAATYQQKQLEQFVTTNKKQLPTLPTLAHGDLIEVQHVPVYDWTPIVTLTDEKQTTTPQRIKKLAKQLALPTRGDGRHRVALINRQQADATTVLVGAHAARLAGATTLELMVRTPQQLIVPLGDYWSGRIPTNRIARLAVIPVAIGTPKSRQQHDLALFLRVGPSTWQLASPLGEIASFPAAAPADGNGPVARLRDHLQRIQAAFPDEQRLALLPQTGASYSALVSAAQATRTSASGTPLFPHLYFPSVIPKIQGTGLTQRISRRWRARVSVEPSTLLPYKPAIRSCYQTQLELRPRLQGELNVYRENNKFSVRNNNVQKTLRDCITNILKPAMTTHKVIAARIALHPK